MNVDFWKKVYKDHRAPTDPSTFAEFCYPMITTPLVELGCGNGRDLYAFRKMGIHAYGVDAAHEDLFIIKQDVNAFIKQNESPDCVYTRFFWHAIDRPTQLDILNWVKKRILIEARTTKDKPQNVCGRHSRQLVNVARLKRDLENAGFRILHISEGRGLSIYKGEDPHLVRVIADKT